MSAAAICLIANLALLAQVPRDRPSAAPPPAGPSGTASISGTVVSADDHHPLALANVVVIGAFTGTLKLTSTDRSGHFSFANLAADRYVVGASKPPYVGAVAGARRPARPGTPIVVANGQKLDGVTVELPRGAAISGTIYDERGLPAANVNVSLQQWKLQGDERSLVTPPNSNLGGTDENGRYRFYGLAPGEYLVAAMRFGNPATRALADSEVDRLLAGRAVDVSFDPLLRAVPVYYPSTPRADDAQSVVVASGEERSGIDIRVAPVRAARLDGIVFGPDGQPVPNATVSLTTASGTSLLRTSMGARTGPDGRFSIPQALPGPQILTAILNIAAPTLFASMAVDVSNGDQTGLQLTMRPPLSIPGQLVFEGASKPPPAGRAVPFRVFGRTGDSFAGVGVTPTGASGDFQLIRVVPGRYLVGGPMSFGASTDSMTWTLKSVVADDKDITDRVLEITDAPPKAVVVTYTDRWQQLSGKLSHQSGAAATDETVIVFPADRAYWYQGSRRIATTRPGSDGLFSFGGPGPTSLPPGEYLLAAVTDLGRDEQFDPSFLAMLVPAAAPVTIGFGEKKTQDLVIR
jgi:protocatechuate 3,4-dioxygenase beta subunit